MCVSLLVGNGNQQESLGGLKFLSSMVLVASARPIVVEHLEALYGGGSIWQRSTVAVLFWFNCSNY